jgi:hypothetical protein
LVAIFSFELEIFGRLKRLIDEIRSEPERRAMNAEKLIRKWKEDETGESPAGAIELTQDELAAVNGAHLTGFIGCTRTCGTPVSICCHTRTGCPK